MHVGPFVLAKVHPTNEHHDNMFGGIIITAHFSKNYIHNGKKAWKQRDQRYRTSLWRNCPLILKDSCNKLYGLFILSLTLRISFDFHRVTNSDNTCCSNFSTARIFRIRWQFILFSIKHYSIRIWNSIGFCWKATL